MVEMRKIKMRVSRREISYVRFLLEAYDGIAGMRTLNPAAGLVEISVPPGRDREWAEFLDHLRQEIMLEVNH